jgi:hypothetical protein
MVIWNKFNYLLFGTGGNFYLSGYLFATSIQYYKIFLTLWPLVTADFYCTSFFSLVWGGGGVFYICIFIWCIKDCVKSRIEIFLGMCNLINVQVVNCMCCDMNKKLAEE